MNVSQLRLVRETIRQHFNLSEVANNLLISQPGVSRQLKELEDELGVEIFERRGKRLVGLTPPGEMLLPVIDRILLDVRNLKRVAGRFAVEDAGELSIATTHTQARYLLPDVLQAFRMRFPRVRLVLRQGSPEQIADWVANGEVDIGVSSEALDRRRELQTFPACTWRHCVVVPAGHELAHGSTRLTLQALSRHPVVTYDEGMSERKHIDTAFAAARLPIEVALAAIDADVIKTYVEAGFGVGILSNLAFDARRDSERLVCLDASHLFGDTDSLVAVRKGAYLREFALELVTMLALEQYADAVMEALHREPPPPVRSCCKQSS
ncbi:LysR substrate-binding domain-containing protein [Thauera linaloolentis]|uniref:Transcriptional regulator CysB-like protein n=1 Tax=Thauera linaloolentis (strain DSM 12138 / JCM 21573 / CCUG 41526 / CIP 105981 / IAM 15112 / NBRC 102519 / 47Lol) TaxID=1123367 RepID=N6YXB2_THAL4|nr:LysR substrate-binding domain-containing protein [Thauera linaloolentis]ENO84584.1 transcriptional regulator CysB-like protein [Thauera linaloolentis 47Lol = DSM 12138]MCM8564235.1 LysR substrate-binding domain-containing protein [Thauera linaloolentis]